MPLKTKKNTDITVQFHHGIESHAVKNTPLNLYFIIPQRVTPYYRVKYMQILYNNIMYNL